MLALTGLNPAHTYSLAIASLHNTGGQTSTFRVGAVEKALAYTSVSDWTEGKTHVLFTNPVHCVVTATDSSTKDYIVITVSAAKAAGGKLFGRLNATAP